jgi:hypothetical protein
MRIKNLRIIIYLLIILFPFNILLSQIKAVPERDKGIKTAYRYLNGAGVELNYEKAYKIFAFYAKQGDAEAINALGMMYKRGLGVRQNEANAFKLFVKSANKGYPKAAFNLGLMYKFGYHVTQSQDSSVYWIEKAQAMGFKGTEYNLGYAYYKGQGKKQDYKKAVSYFKSGAEKGDASSMFNLGYCYYKGRGVERNPELGKYWIEKAGEKGLSRAIDFISKNDSKSFGEAKKKLKSATLEPINAFIPLKYKTVKNSVSNSNITGEWEGKIINYDWSGEEIESETPIRLTLQSIGDGIDGLWVENETAPVRIEAQMLDSIWVFNNTRLYENQRPLDMTDAQFKLEKINGKEYLCGNIKFYSETTKEFSTPSYVVLERKASQVITEISNNEQVVISPNPFDTYVNVTMQLERAQNISIIVYDMQGRKVYKEIPKHFEIGNNSVTINLSLSRLTNGNYIMKIVGETINKSSIIIKQ